MYFYHMACCHMRCSIGCFFKWFIERFLFAPWKEEGRIYLEFDRGAAMQFRCLSYSNRKYTGFAFFSCVGKSRRKEP